MSEVSEITIPVRVPVKIESSDALPELTKVTEGVDNLRTAIDVLRNSNQESIIPGFVQGIDEQISITEDNVNNLIYSRKRIDTAQTSQERDVFQKNFIQAYNRAITSVENLFKGIKASDELSEMLTDDVRDVFSEALRPAATGLRKSLTDTAKTLSSKSGNQTLGTIISAALGSNEVMGILAENGLTSEKGITKQTVQKYFEAISPYAVPKMFDAQYLDWDKMSKSKPIKVADRLPSKARGLFNYPNAPKQQIDTDSYSLTENENKKLQDYLTAHPYMLREAEQAGIVRRENGNIYYNPNTTRAHVGAFGGNVVEMFASGIQGGPSTGYTDVRRLSPEEERRAVNKSNLYTTSSEHAAQFLESNFSWFRPEHVVSQRQEGFKPSSSGWTNIGKVTGDPRIDAMEFYEVSLDDIQNGKISIPKWDKETPYEQRPFIRVNRSLMQNVLSQQRGATPFQHNGFNNNEIYVKLPNEELSNYETTPERIAEIRDQMAAAVSASLGDTPYEFTGFTGTHMVLTRKDLVDEIKKNPETKDFFTNGNPHHVFEGDYEGFARANAYAKLLRTEGADVQEQYGTDLSDITVVVGDLKKATGLDGQRLVSSRYFPQSFQHRDFGGKGTSQAVDLDTLWELYPERIAQEDIPEEGIHKGDLVFPRGGYGDTNESPKKLVLPRGVGVVEDATLLKTKGRYAGMTQEEINNARTQEMRQYGVLTKTSSEGFDTPVSYISAQEASTLQLTPEAIDYFKQVGIKSLRELNDPDAVKRVLFSGNDPLSKIVQEDEGSLALPAAQERISEYRRKLNGLMRGANLILPHNSAQYSMLQAWVPDIFNQLIGEENLTEEQKKMSLRSLKKDSSVDDVVAYFGSKDADLLQLYRNPSTAGGNITAENAAVDDFFQNLSTALGLDQKALYADPSSEILKRMQTADFDGDTVFVQALKSNETLRNIMLPVLAATAERYKAIKEASGYSDAEQDERAQSRWKQLIDDEGQSYDFDNPIDRINWYINSKKRDAKMGLSNSISLSARQYKMSETVARATRDVQDHYDAVSNAGFKENKDYEVTPDEWNIARGGSPFYQLHNWIDKATTVEYERGDKEPWTKKQVIDYDSINKRSLDKLNFESVNDPNAKLAAMRNYIANNLYPEEQEEYNKVIDDVFAHMPEIDESTSKGQFQAAMRDLRKRRAKGEWLVMDRPTLQRMDALSLKAYKEIQEEVGKDGSIDARHEEAEVQRRYADIGGQAYENEKLFGFTGRYYNDAAFRTEMADLARASSTNHVFSNAKWVPDEISDWEKQRREAEENYNKQKAELERLQREEAEKAKEREAALKQQESNAKSEPQPELQAEPTSARQTVSSYEPSDAFKQAITERDAQNNQSKSQPPAPPSQPPAPPSQPPAPPRRNGGFGPDAPRRSAATQEAEEKTAAAKQALDQYDKMEPAIGEISRVKNLLDEQLRSFRNGIIKKEHQLEGTSDAELYLGRQIGITTSLEKEIDNLLSDTNTETQAVFNSGVVGAQLKQSLQAGKRQLQIGLYEDFFEWTELQAKNTIEGIDTLLDKEINKPSKQKENLNEQQERLNQLKETHKILTNKQDEKGFHPLGRKYSDSTLTGRLTEDNEQERLRDLREKALSENENAIVEQQSKIEELQKYYTTVNEASFEDSLNELALKIDPSKQKNSPEVLSKARMKMIEKARETLEKHKSEGLYSEDVYNSHLARLAELEKLSSVEAIEEEQSVKKNAQDAKTRLNLAKLRQDVTGRTPDRRESFKNNYDRLIAERDEYKAQHLHDEDFDNEAFDREFSNSALRRRAREITDYEKALEGLSSDNQEIQTEALLSGGGLVKEDRIRIEINKRKAARERRANEMRMHGENPEAWLSKHADQMIEQQVRDQFNQNEQISDLQLMHREQAVQDQIAAQARQREWSREDFNRSRRMMRFGGNTMFARNYQAYESRRLQDERSIPAYQDRNSALYRRNSEIEEELKKTDLSDERRKALESEKESNQSLIQGNIKAIGEAQQEIEKLSGAGATLQAVFDTAGQTIGRLAARLGRQMFQKALQETKRFIKEYDAAMTSIQMITLKSDDEMSKVGDGLINKAKELKISISEITQMSTELYRQGLNDEEMDERLDVIAKFSKVSGTKAKDATKLITTAMNTGLVDNAQYAADVVTMLGDSAATNAAQIEKGIEKAGAAAAVDGTTYGQLVSLLTAVTATTQVTGNIAGTTLNSIFGRMNKVGTNELVYDENGNAMSGSAIAKLLRAQGIETNQADGSRRSSFDMLYDLAQRYDTMSDDEQRQLATAIAGTRQFSNFSAIMAGIKDGDIDKYLELIDKAEGITDQKYDVYAESLQASLDNFRNSFDSLVKDLVDSGIATGVIDFFTNIINGIDNIVARGSKLAGILTILMPIAGVLTAAVGAQTGNLALLGVGAGLLVGGIASGAAGNMLVPQKSAKETYVDYKKTSQEKLTSTSGDISRAQELLNKGKDRTKEEQNEFSGLLYKLNTQFGLSTDSLKNLSSGAEDAASALDELGKATMKEADKRKNEEQVKTLFGGTNKAAKSILEQAESSQAEFNESGSIYSYGLFDYLWGSDGKGNITVKDNIGYKEFSEREKESLATLLSDAGSLYLGDSGIFQNQEKYNDKNAWTDIINDRAIPAFLNNMPAFMEGLNNYLAQQTLFGVESGTGYKKNTISSLVSSYLMDEGLAENESEAKLLADQISSDYAQATTGWDPDTLTSIINGVIGYDSENPDFSWEHIRASIRNYKEEHNIPLTVAEDATKSGLEYLGEGTYYVDQNEKRYTYEEAKAATQPVYRGQEYATMADAEAQREKNKQEDLIKAYNEIEPESYITYNGKNYSESEEDYNNLLNDIYADAKTRIAKSQKNTVAYRNQNGELVSSDQMLGETEEAAEVYDYLDKNGKLTFSANKTEVENLAAKEYTDTAFLDMLTHDFEAYKDMHANYPASEWLDVVSEWAKSNGRQSYQEFSQDKINTFNAANPVNIKDLSEEEKDKYLIAHDQALQEKRSQYTPATNAFEINGKLYDNLEDAIDDNIRQFTDQILEEYGVSDVSELPALPNENSRYRWQDEWFDTLEEARAAIEQQITELYESAEEQIKVTNPQLFKVYQDKVSPKVELGAQAWETSNNQKLLANQFMRLISGKNISSYTDFLAQTGLEGQQLLVDLMAGDKNNELANILSGAVVNKGEVQYEEEGLYNSLLEWVAGTSTIGRRSTSKLDRANIAAAAFDDLLDESQTIYMTQAEANKDYETYKANDIKSLAEGGAPQHVIDYLQEQPELSQAEWNKQNNIRVLSDSERNYLKEIITDEDLLASLLNQDASLDQIGYARRLINNAQRGINGLTTRDRYAGMQEIASAINEGRYAEYDQNIAAQYMQGMQNWTEYAGLLIDKESGKPVDEEQLAAYRKQFEEFQKAAQMQIQLEGVKALEDAGELLEGTYELIQKIQKGGKFKIEAEIEISAQAAQNGQTLNKLVNGTIDEKSEAAMEVLQMTDEAGRALFATDREGYIKQAENVFRKTVIEPEAASLIEERNRYMPGERAAFDERMAARGWIYQPSKVEEAIKQGAHVDQNGNVIRNGVIDAELTRQLQERQTGTYTYQPGNVLHENPYDTTKRIAYTSSEILTGMETLLAGGTIEDQDLLQAVYSAGGDQFNQYIAAVKRNDSETVAKFEKGAREAVRRQEQDVLRDENRTNLQSTFRNLGYDESTASNMASQIDTYQYGSDREKREIRQNLGRSSFDRRQQRAKLYNGTVNQQDEAAMAQLGMGREEYYARRDENLRKAKEASDQELREYVKQFNDEYREASADVQQEMNLRASSEGLIYDPALQGFVAGPNANIANVNAFAGGQRRLNASQLVELQKQLVAETLTKDSENYEDYLQAAQNVGDNTYNYLLGLSNGLDKNSEEMIELKKKADAELEKASKEAQDAVRLEELELAGDYTGYARERFKQTNRAALAAQEAFTSRGQYSDIQSFLSGQTSVEGWDELEKSQEYYNWTRQFLDKNGKLKSGYTYEQAMAAFGNLTLDYQGMEDTSRSEILRRAQDALTSTDRTANNANAAAIKEVYGDNAYQKWLRGKTVGQSEIEQTRALNYRYGLTGLTTSQVRAGQADVQRMIANGSLQSYLIASSENEERQQYLSQVMQGFSDWGDYAALVMAQGTDEFDKLGGQEELDRLTEKLELFQKNAQIEIDVEGLQTLEQAGELLEGTAASIERLQKGGKIALDELLNIQNNAYKSGQQYAQLMTGTTEEQDAAAMAYLGMDRTQFYSNYEANMAYADFVAGQDRTALGDQLFAQYYNANEDQKKSIKDYAKTIGIKITRRGWEDTGVPETDWVAPEVGQAKGYTDLQKAAYGRRMLEGDAAVLEGGEEFDKNLYEASYNSLGFYGREYQNRLNSTDAAVKATAEEYREKALEEAKLAEKDAQESQEVADARLSGNSFRYARALYQQNNKAGLAANSLYTAITSDNVKNWSDFANIIGTDQKENWDELIKSAPELTKQFEDAGLVFDEAGNFDLDATIESIRVNGGDLAQALATVASLIGDKSIDFKDRDYETRGETIANASGFETWDSTTKLTDQQLSAARQIYGDTLVAKRRDANYQWTAEDQAEANRRALNYQYGVEGVNDLQAIEGANELLAHMREGTLASHMEGGGYENTSAWMGQFQNASRYFQMAQALEGSGYSMDNLADIENNAKAIAIVDERLKAVGASYKTAVNTAKDFTAELRTKGISALTQYGDYSEDVAKNVANLAKGGKTATQTVAQLTSRMAQMNNAMFAASNAKGKSGKQLGNKDVADLAAASGFTEGLIKEMSQEQIQKLAEDVESQVNQEFTEHIGGTIQEALQNAAETEEITVEQLVKFDVNADGQLDLSEIEAAASALHSEGLAALASYAGFLGTLFLKINKNATSVSGALEFAGGSMNSGGAGKRLGGGGGGGGGGKSAVDKLLEEQKHKVAEAQHNIKMLDIQEKYYDRTNDYETYIDFLDEEVAAQEKLQALYKSNLKEMNDMLGSVAEGTDDWYKLKEAIFSAEEAMADINNTIAEINAKQIAIRTEQFENEDKPRTHKTTMLETLASRYMSAKEYDNYNKTMQTQIEATREQISENNKQIATWEGMLTSYEENSDQWIEVRDKIWALREENASLENQALDSIIEMNNQKVSQIAEELQHNQAFDNHAVNMYSTYGQMYQSNRQYTDYRNTLTESNVSQGNLIASYQGSIDELRDLMSTLDMTSDAWYSARDSIFQYEEAIAQARASIQENNAAIQQSVVEELTTDYDRMMSDIDHEIKVLQNQKQIYDNANDFDAYIEMMKQEKNATQDMVSTMRDGLAEMEYQIGTIDEDSEAWWNLHDKILRVREAISDAEVNLENFDREIEQSKLDHLIEKFGKIDEIDTHNLKMIQYAETFYQNRGELTNYGTMLSTENEYQQRYADDLRDHIRLLEEERDNVEVGSDAYYKLEQQIMKYEEQLEQTNNSIDKNNKLLEQNAEKIRQTVMTVENYVDKEIRARIQKSRDMLAAEVSMQNTILDTIKTRYKQEWDLVKQDINKKKEALNQEKSLINERLRARKEATDQADQYEELAEYKRQLALLSADPTRTKEAKELSKKISDMEKDIAYNIAQSEANAESERIDEQVRAYDDYMRTAEEDLNMLLADSDALMADAQQKLGVNVTELMEGSWSELLNWLSANNVAFRDATAEVQEQMTQSWEDTWKKMYGIIDTYWKDVHSYMEDYTTFIEYMKESDTYNTASKTGKESLDYKWTEAFEDMVAAIKDTAEFDHDHELEDAITSKIDEAKNWTYKVELDGAPKNWIEAFSLNDYMYGQDHIPVDTSDIILNDLYTGVGKIIEQVIKEAAASTPSSGDDGGSGSSGGPRKPANSGTYYVDDARTGEQKEFKSLKEAQHYANSLGDGVILDSNLNNVNYDAKEGNSKTSSAVAGVAAVVAQNIIDATKDAVKNAFGFAEGGLVTHTGLVQVHGSYAEPESFLDAVDTKQLAALTDALNYVTISSHPINVPDTYTGNNTTVGDVVINIAQADLGSDASIEEVAKKVGKAFSKQLSKQGLNLTSVSF